MLFKLWLEADHDYPWSFVNSTHSRKMRELIPPEEYKRIAPMVQAAVDSFDPDYYDKIRYRSEYEDDEVTKNPILTNLNPESKSALVNWITFWVANPEYYWHLSGNNHNPDSIPSTILSHLTDLAKENLSNKNFWSKLKMTKKIVGDDGDTYEVPAFGIDDLDRSNERIRQINRYSKASEKDRVGPEGRQLVTFPNKWSWVALDRGYCPDEGKAGRHCGNVSPQQGDNIISLRNPSGHVMATLVVMDGTLRECKGVGNHKLDPTLHPYLADLFLAHGPEPLPINRLDFSTSYLSDNDTGIADLMSSSEVTPEQKVALSQKFNQNYDDSQGKRNQYILDSAWNMLSRSIYRKGWLGHSSPRTAQRPDIYWTTYLDTLHKMDSFINFFATNWQLLLHQGVTKMVPAVRTFGKPGPMVEKAIKVEIEEIAEKLVEMEDFYREIDYGAILAPQFSSTTLDHPQRRETKNELKRVSRKLLSFLGTIATEPELTGKAQELDQYVRKAVGLTQSS